MSRKFTGNDADRLVSSNNAAYGFTSAQSIAFWVKRSTVSTNNDVPVGVDNNDWRVFLFSGDDKDYWSRTAGNANSTTAISDITTWHHCAMTSDGAGNITFYLDGAADGTATKTNNAPGAHVINIGSLAGVGASGLYGKLAYVTLWNAALTSGDITTLQTSTTPETVSGGSCVGAWHMDTDDGASIIDSSSTAINLTITGTVAFDSDNPLALGGGGGPPKTALLLLKAGG